MKLITIQDTNVEKQLAQTGMYVANFDRAPDNLKGPYRKMSKHYGWNTCPVFCGVVGKYAEFYGAKTENAMAFQLDVPDKNVKIQAYYDWTDFVYFTEIPNEFHDSYDTNIFPTLDDFGTYMLDGNPPTGLPAIQATIPYIEAEWIADKRYVIANMLAAHNGTGGANILQELYCY